jgi:hypothetical protein
MGIPGLQGHFAPYAISTTFPANSPRQHSAVIDGPSLAYHAHSIYLAALKKSYRSGHTSKASGFNATRAGATPSLGAAQAFIAWLDALGKHGFDVSGVVFDGNLPRAKEDIRRERMTSTIKTVRRCRQLWSTDYDLAREFTVTPSSNVVVVDDFSYEDLFNTSAPPSEIPPPLNLVSSVAEILRKSKNYHNKVFFVPGEADGYCASLAARRGGIVFTADSDSLAHDIGPSGKVVLFRELEFIKNAIHARVYHLASIAKKFKLKSCVPFGYAVKCDRWMPLHPLVDRARRMEKERPDDYVLFEDEYALRESRDPLQVPETHLGQSIQSVDVALSEWLCQIEPCLSLTESSDHATMWLPILLDDPHRASPWASESVVFLRQIAYSLLSPTALTITIESRRKGIELGFTEVPHISPVATVQAIQATKTLLWTINNVISNHIPSVTQWRHVGLYTLLKDLKAEEASIDVGTILAVFNGQVMGRNWIAINLFARLQAACVSWRLLRQAVEVYDKWWLGESNEPAVKELREAMISIEGHRLVDMMDPLQNVAIEETTAMINDMFQALDIKPIDSQVDKKRKRKKDRDQKKNLPKALDASNLYSILSSIKEP